MEEYPSVSGKPFDRLRALRAVSRQRYMMLYVIRYTLYAKAQVLTPSPLTSDF